MLRPSVVGVTAAFCLILGLTGTAVGSASASNETTIPSTLHTATSPSVYPSEPAPPSATSIAITAVPIAQHAEPAKASTMAELGIPSTALAAYRQAAASAPAACGVTWPLIAAIGRVESDDGRAGGAVLHTDGTSTPKIIGIALDGSGTALIPDTDHGRLDGDAVYDRAVGPMQFIPSTWAIYGVDANGDHVADPFNIFDAAATTARYLCAAAGNVSTAQGMTRSVSAYNHSDAYVASVLALETTYAGSAPVVTAVAPNAPAPVLPPANPGPPAAIVPDPATAPTSTPTSATASGTVSVTAEDTTTSAAPTIDSPPADAAASDVSAP
jgi:membrane-bound lytic murein transglycosylase B